MIGEETDVRVLVAAPRAESDGGDGGDTATVVTTLDETIPGETVTKRGETAVEYLKELGPTVDCVVVSDDAGLAEEIHEASSNVPLVVYGCDAPAATIDAVVPRSSGPGALADRISLEIEQARERDHLVEANAKLTALSRYASKINGCETVAEVCERTLDAAVEALAFNFCTIALIEGDRIVPVASTLPDEERASCRVSEGIAGRTVRTGETQVVGDMQSDPDSVFRQKGQRAVLSVPIGDRGIIQVVSEYDDEFGQQDAEFVEILSGYTNEALQRLDREAALRAERDRLFAFFAGLPVPAVYVEAEAGTPATLMETNDAYEEVFPEAGATGQTVDRAFPTETEQRLFDGVTDEGAPVTRRIERSVADRGAVDVSVTMVPVQVPGPTYSAYGVYLVDPTVS
jgi:putative methionine-R-sulfoxide reductase with GAF domain